MKKGGRKTDDRGLRTARQSQKAVVGSRLEDRRTNKANLNGVAGQRPDTRLLTSEHSCKTNPILGGPDTRHSIVPAFQSDADRAKQTQFPLTGQPGANHAKQSQLSPERPGMGADRQDRESPSGSTMRNKANLLSAGRKDHPQGQRPRGRHPPHLKPLPDIVRNKANFEASTLQERS